MYTLEHRLDKKNHTDFRQWEKKKKNEKIKGEQMKYLLEEWIYDFRFLAIISSIEETIQDTYKDSQWINNQKDNYEKNNN